MNLSKYFQQVCLHRYRKYGHMQKGDTYVPIYRCTVCKKEKLEPNKGGASTLGL